MRHVDHHQLKTKPVRLGHGLIVYKQPKRPGRGSPNWYARVTLPVGGRKVHTKTTGTSDLRLATERAQEFQGELLLSKQGGILPQGKLSDRAYRFDVIADAWLDELKASAGGDERKLHRYHDHRKILTAPNGLVAFFGRRDIRMITPQLIKDYLGFAERGSKLGVFKPTTKKNHLATLSKMLNAAMDMGRLTLLPRLPTIRIKDDPRPPFTADEYRKLNLVCWSFERYLARTGDRRQLRRSQELRDFIVFMVNSFLRPSEWADLKQKHVEVITGDHLHLRITVVGGKTGMRIAVTMPGAVRAYERILKRCGSDPEQYVFMPEYRNRATAKERMADWFAALLEQAGMTCDSFGRKRTLYSLRHTALTLRVLHGDGVDLLALAKNAGTSLKILERFYCSHLEPEQKIANLQSFKVHRFAEESD